MKIELLNNDNTAIDPYHFGYTIEGDRRWVIKREDIRLPHFTSNGVGSYLSRMYYTNNTRNLNNIIPFPYGSFNLVLYFGRMDIPKEIRSIELLQ